MHCPIPRSLALAALFALPVTLSAQAAGKGGDALSAAERSLVRAVDTRASEGLALLERIVNINSGTMNFAGVRAVGDALRAEFDALGFTTRWVDGAPFERAGHLVAEFKGGGSGPHLLLIGHLDTVFEPGSPFQKFERLSDSTARGPGIIDMKGGDVIIVQALKALKATGALADMHVSVIMHGDEEKAGTPQDLAREDIRSLAKGARYAIGFEDGSGDPRTAVVARRSAGGWVLTSTGIPAHSSQIFREDIGFGAIYESARVLNAFRERLATQQYLTFNPGVALGGTDVRLDSTVTDGAASGKTNVVAKSMQVSGDIRTISPEQLAESKRVMQDIAAQSLPGTTSRITFDDGYPPMAPTDGNRELLARYDQVSRALGYGAVVAVDPSKAGAADVSFVAPFVSAAIDGVGLAGWDDHTDKETADLRMLAPLTKRAAVLLYRLHAEGRPKA
ncbi:MAG: M20/M25/M40 family metallo-hydrolase [Gemmatimonadaceae bacterium]|nr:M20/M25/M40 family metallo-hydrolase [Gemmatimonadaceae bacterium]